MNNFGKKIIGGFLLSSLISVQVFAGSADDLLKRVEKNLHSKDESAHVKMVVLEANGSERDRDLVISRLEGDDGQSIMVRIQSPADLRGMGLLSVSNHSQTDQWLYLPSSKQTRRILSAKRSSNFLDSELSYEDMGSGSTEQMSNQIVKSDVLDGVPHDVVESVTKNPDSAYSKLLTWVSTKTNLVSKIEYYDRSGKLLKTTTMSDYKKFGGNVWRALKVSVTNAQNHRSTRLDLVDLKINIGLSSANFSPSALANP